MEGEREELLQLYLREARELLKSVNTSLLELEKDPSRLDMIEEVARCVHTLKSNSAAMEFTKLAELAHRVEDVVAAVKEGRLTVDDAMINLLFECFDALEASVEAVAEKKPELEFPELLQKLSSELERGAEKEAKGIELAYKPHTLKPIRAVEVEIETLDRLMDLIGEQLILGMRFRTLSEKYKLKEFEELIDDLLMLTDNLQYEVTKARMIPVNQVFARFPRMVRDLAKKQEKKVELRIEGGETRLDRTVLDKIGEPLIHLLRNAVDHGIEDPETRKRLGKPEVGVIKLVAKRLRDSVIIEVSDDGAGFDVEKIRKVAVERGFVTEEATKAMSKKDLIELTFLPGFSTSEQVTEVSGRGVGLDVVRMRIKEISGSVSVETEKDKGTTVILQLPQTLAIVRCLLFRLGGERFAVPVANVRRIVKLEPALVRTITGEIEVMLLEGEDIPLVRLDKIFNIPSALDVAIIVEHAGWIAGLAVGSIIGQEDVIIKPIPPLVRGIKGVGGATILGDGEPAIVLDIASIFELAVR